MGVFLEIVDFDHEFNSLAKIPTVLNDLEERSEKDKEEINRSIYTKYTSDLLTNIPSCECGLLQGEDAIGVKCDVCHTEVKPSIEDELESLIWIRAPLGVKALINPTCWKIISSRYTKSNFNVLRYICDIGYNPSNRRINALEEVRASGLQRGFNYFVENFDAIIEALNQLPSFRIKKNEVDYTSEFIRENRTKIFCRYIPILNKSILVFEDDNQGNFVDSSVPGVVNAARIMVSIDKREELTPKQRENRAIKAVIQLSDVYESMNHNAFLSGKPGLLRKHIFGSRSYFSFRAVISSLTDPHHYREIHIPWGVATAVFSVHIKNMLLKQGMTANEANSFIYAHAQRYHPTLDKIFHDFIESSPYPNTPYTDVRTGETAYLRGIPCTMARNPSLKINSIQLVYITKVKTDVTDPTVTIPILVVHPLNADYDGISYYFAIFKRIKLLETLARL